jgi:hypothetical protein
MAEPEISDARSASERRTSDRKKLIVDVNFEGGEGTGIANTRDIGAGGLYMTTTSRLETGAAVSMSMVIAGRTLNLKGVVVYSDPGHGVGVRFRDLDEADEQFLTAELQTA